MAHRRDIALGFDSLQGIPALILPQTRQVTKRIGLRCHPPELAKNHFRTHAMPQLDLRQQLVLSPIATCPFLFRWAYPRLEISSPDFVSGQALAAGSFLKSAPAASAWPLITAYAAADTKMNGELLKRTG